MWEWQSYIACKQVYTKKIKKNSRIRKIPGEQYFHLKSRQSLGGTPPRHDEDKWCSRDLEVAEALFNDAIKHPRLLESALRFKFAVLHRCIGGENIGLFQKNVILDVV